MKTKIKTLSFLAVALLVLGSSVLINRPNRASAAGSNTTLKWSTHAAAGNGTWTSVTWSPELSKFVAVARASTFPVATNKRMMTSVDGKNWVLANTANIPAAAAAFTSVAWSPELGLFVAVACVRGSPSTCSNGATNLRAMTSPDGEVWTERVTADQTSTWQSIVWSAELNLFVAVADTGDNSIMTSSDGITWTARIAPQDNAWKSVTWSPGLGLLVAVSTNGTNRVMTSPDGINWTSQSASEANSWVSVTWSPELSKFVAVSSDGTNRVMTSTNGTTWTAQAAAAANAWSSVTWAPGLLRFVAVANGGTNRIMTSPDGVTWTAQAASADHTWNAVTWAPGLNTFVAVGTGGSFDTGTSTSPRVMTGAMITATTNEASSIATTSAVLNGEYLDNFPAANLFFTGSNVFFRYRLAGSGNPFTGTPPQAVSVQGPFTVNAGSLVPGADYEFKAVVQWASAAGTETLEGALSTFVTPPAMLAAPDMVAATDSGSSNTDDLTNDNTPDFTGSCTNGNTIMLYGDATLIGQQVCSSGSYVISSTVALADGLRSITATATNSANDVSALSPALNITVDTAAPTTPATPDMTAATDSGVSSTDNITNDTTPDFIGVCTPGELLTFYMNGNPAGTQTCSGGGSYAFTPSSPLADGSYAVRLTASDIAGNTSTQSLALDIAIDAASDAAPVITDPANGSTIVDSTPLIIGTGQPGGIVTLTDTNTSTAVCTTPVDTSGNWSCTPTAPFDEGINDMTVSGEDAAGNLTDTSAYTLTIDTSDVDADGISGSVEDAGPNSGDANNDGTADSNQAHVASLVNSATSKYVVVELNNICSINSAASGSELANDAEDSAFSYPVGLINFTADCVTPGFIADVKLYFFGATSNGLILRKYNPNTGVYFNVNGSVLEEVVIGGQAAVKASYQVTDGGELDTDTAANGTIVDPVGLALATSTPLVYTGQSLVLPIFAAGMTLASLITAFIRHKRFKQHFV